MANKLVFFNNSLNHHQVHVADELYKLLGEEYSYVTTVSKDRCGKKGGVDYSDRPYCILAGDSKTSFEKAMKLAKTADVCVFGAESLSYAIERAQKNPKGLSFELSERWLKRGWLNIFSPRLIRWWVAYQRYFRNANFYKLNASAFAAKDHEKLMTYQGKCFKWGYFTSVPLEPTEDPDKNQNLPVRMMWCSRFLKLKHPELPLMMCAKLKDRGYCFELDYYGDDRNAAKWELVYHKSELEKLLNENNLMDKIHLYGSISNELVLKAMREHDVFLFTSDNLEGWGVVANESMSQGCVLVASDAIGSSPFLIKDGYNGFQFKSCDVDSLTEKVEWLLNHRSELRQMKTNAQKIMHDIWSPRRAAENLLLLIDDLQNGRNCSIIEGPGSVAELI